jgi:hypothetical protein
MPTFARRVAEQYRDVIWLMSTITASRHPRVVVQQRLRYRLQGKFGGGYPHRLPGLRDRLYHQFRRAARSGENATSTGSHERADAKTGSQERSEEESEPAVHGLDP